MAEGAITAARKAGPAAAEALRTKAGELFGVDLRSLAALRMALAAVVLGDLLARAADLTVFYTDDGALPRPAALGTLGPWDWSLHLLGGAPLASALLFALHAAAALALLVGLRTRVAALVCWAMTLSLQNRNVLVSQGGDELLRLLLFWGLFTPLGARWSLDALRDDPPLAGRALSTGTAALLLQVAFVYWFTWVHKFGPEWEDGSSLYWTLANDHYARPWAQRLLLPHAGAMRGLSRAVFAFELWGPTLLFFPLAVGPVRLACIAGFVALQAGMGLTMHLDHFPLVSIAAMLAFVPAPAWDWLQRRSFPAAPRLRERAERLASRLRATPAGVTPRPWAQLAAALLLLLAFAVNLAGIENTPLNIPTAAEDLSRALGLDQRWAMFAPAPVRDSGWYVIPGTLADGREVDLFPAADGRATLAEPRWERPPHLAARFRSGRWMDYFARLRERDDEGLWSALTAHLCDRWNEAHTGGEELESLEVVFVREEVPEPGQPRAAERESLWEGSCE